MFGPYASEEHTLSTSRRRPTGHSSTGGPSGVHFLNGYNILAIPVAAGVLYKLGILLGPAAGAALMSLNTVIVAINARRLKMER